MGEINITPLVDVMLVLLVIFMVTAPLVSQQVDVQLPETKSKKALMVDEKDLILVIDRKQNISINQTKIALSDLTEKLNAIYKNKSKKEIFLQADHRIPYGFVVKVMALVKNAGVQKMGMITLNEKQDS